MKNVDVFTFSPIIDIDNLDLVIYTNPMHGESGIENMEIDLDDAERHVCKYIKETHAFRKIIADRIREYANAIEAGDIKGYISDYDGYPVSDTVKVESIDWNLVKQGGGYCNDAF